MDGIFMPADDVIEQLAQLIHQDYLNQLEQRDPAIPTHRSWVDLREEDRELSRAQARDNVVKLHRRGLFVAPIGTSDQISELPDEAVEDMAIEEHRSWIDRRRSRGYRYGPVRCDDLPDLRHPDMVAWADLDEAIRERDRRPIRNISTHLRAVELTLVRR